MKEKRIIIKSLNDLPPGKTNWSKVKKMTEKEIALAAKSDPDANLSTLKQLHHFKRVHPPKKIDVKKIREKLHLTQAEFAAYFGINERTLQQWEQHRSEPNSLARNFLRVIERNPKAVQQALN
jgi:putative transcriptional regulator